MWTFRSFVLLCFVVIVCAANPRKRKGKPEYEYYEDYDEEVDTKLPSAMERVAAVRRQYGGGGGGGGGGNLDILAPLVLLAPLAGLAALYSAAAINSNSALLTIATINNGKRRRKRETKAEQMRSELAILSNYISKHPEMGGLEVNRRKFTDRWARSWQWKFGWW